MNHSTTFVIIGVDPTTMASNEQQVMLVTGGTGFVALHCIAQALAAGYQVRTTVRSAGKKDTILKGLANAKPPVDATKLEFVTADLLKDDGWNEAVEGVQLVLHVASPFPAKQPRDENDLIRPAVDGTLRVLKAAKAAGTVTRVVVTSSVAAVAYGVAFENGRTFTEEDWSDPQGRSITPYAKSKTLAEKAAWEFIENDGGGMELATVNPVGIYGPALVLPNESTTCNAVKDMLSGKYPMLPNVSFGVVDVRDVAALHMLAATRPEAKGQRFIANADGGSRTLIDMAKDLREGLGARASKLTTRAMPDFLIKPLSYVIPDLKAVSQEIGKLRLFSNDKAKTVLGWNPKSAAEATVSCGQAWIDAGLLK